MHVREIFQWYLEKVRDSFSQVRKGKGRICFGHSAALTSSKKLTKSHRHAGIRIACSLDKVAAVVLSLRALPVRSRLSFRTPYPWRRAFHFHSKIYFFGISSRCTFFSLSVAKINLRARAKGKRCFENKLEPMCRVLSCNLQPATHKWINWLLTQREWLAERPLMSSTLNLCQFSPNSW